MLDSIPHPMTTDGLRKLRDSPSIVDVHPEVIATRLSDGEVVPAFLLVTTERALAIVESPSRNGYEVLTRGDEDRVYDELQAWCEQNGYLEQR